jgi:SulP family sulfate permease
LRARSLRHDGIAGLVLGVQSVPDALATGLLAGVNPTAGLNAYLFGTATGALFTSSAFMAVQATGAMAMLVADVDTVRTADDPTRVLVTLTLMTGIVMLAAGLLHLGTVLRFVSNAVMVGFINAVGVNIVLSQLADLTGYRADGANRVTRAFNTLVNPSQVRAETLTIGIATIVLIVLLERTRLRALGLVVALALTSLAVGWFGWDEVLTLSDLGIDVGALPRPELPQLSAVPALLLPAASLAFVGLVQGAGISANYPNPDGSYPEASRDFVGQGAANIAAGLFRGMPVGGSLSATALNTQAGARSRSSLLITSLVMVVVIVAFGDLIGGVAMPALAGLLMLIGYRTINPENLQSVWRTGAVQKTVLVVTFSVTLIVPLQIAVLVGVALSIVLHTIRQSNKVTVRRRSYDADGHATEIDPPTELAPNDVVVLQPYGSLFFAAASTFESALPVVTDGSRHSVVILRLRGRSDLGTTFMDVLHRYTHSLQAVGSKLVIVSADERIIEQLRVTGVADTLGDENLYPGDERVGAAVRRAVADAHLWVNTRR